MKRIVCDILAKNPLFGDLNEPELDALADICEIRKYPRNALIFSESQPAHYFFLIHKGSVNLIFNSHQIIRVGNGEIFGDWAMINDTVRLATARTVTDLDVIAIDSHQFKDHTRLPAHISFKVLLQLSRSLVSRLQSQSQIASRILIGQGESEQVEFKSSLRKNLFTNKNDSAIEHSVLKNIAGFLNRNGGVLFIGVTDQGEICGINHDGFENEDKFLLHLGKLINQRLDTEAASYVSYNVVHLENHSVVRIDCQPAQTPIFLQDGKQQYFYVRTGVQTVAFQIRETLSYIKARF